MAKHIFRMVNWSRLLYILIIIAVILFIIKNIQHIEQFNFDINQWYLAAGVLFLSLGYILTSIIWVQLAISFNLKAPIIKTHKAWFLSQLGKYIPGKVTLLLVRFDCYQQYPKKIVTIATCIEYMTMLASSSILVLIALALSPKLIPDYLRIASIVGAVLLCVLLRPSFFIRLTNAALRLVKKEAITEYPSYGFLLLLVGKYFCVNLIMGMGIFCSFNSLSPLGFEHFLILSGIYESAALLGLAALFAPSGIGVREGILFLTLPLILPQSTMIVGVILIRLLTTLIELALALIFVGLDRFYPILQLINSRLDQEERNKE